MIRYLIVFTLILSILAPGKAVFADLKINSLAPSLTLPNLNGEPVFLESFQGKKAVLLTFWTTWGKSCKDELRLLQRLIEEYGSEKLEVIGISLDKDVSAIQAFLNENKIKITVLQDKKNKSLDKFHILIIPTLFVIDKNGILKNIYVDFDENVKKLVEKDVKALLVP
jgi:peroxiredoxin